MEFLAARGDYLRRGLVWSFPPPAYPARGHFMMEDGGQRTEDGGQNSHKGHKGRKGEGWDLWEGWDLYECDGDHAGSWTEAGGAFYGGA
jgi:hypothetical protein